MRLSLLLLLATSPAALAGGLSPSGLILSDGGLSSQSAPTVVDDDPLVMRPDLLGSLGDDDVLSRAKALIEAAGLDGVGRRGRIDMRDLTLRTGAYLLNEDGCGGSSSLPPPAPSGQTPKRRHARRRSRRTKTCARHNPCQGAAPVGRAHL
jgi:hypothetical protein